MPASPRELLGQQVLEQCGDRTQQHRSVWAAGLSQGGHLAALEIMGCWLSFNYKTFCAHPITYVR